MMVKMLAWRHDPDAGPRHSKTAADICASAFVVGAEGLSHAVNKDGEARQTSKPGSRSCASRESSCVNTRNLDGWALKGCWRIVWPKSVPPKVWLTCCGVATWAWWKMNNSPQPRRRTRNNARSHKLKLSRGPTAATTTWNLLVWQRRSNESLQRPMRTEESDDADGFTLGYVLVVAFFAVLARFCVILRKVAVKWCCPRVPTETDELPCRGQSLFAMSQRIQNPEAGERAEGWAWTTLSKGHRLIYKVHSLEGACEDQKKTFEKELEKQEEQKIDLGMDMKELAYKLHAMEGYYQSRRSHTSASWSRCCGGMAWHAHRNCPRPKPSPTRKRVPQQKSPAMLIFEAWRQIAYSQRISRSRPKWATGERHDVPFLRSKSRRWNGWPASLAFCNVFQAMCWCQTLFPLCEFSLEILRASYQEA